MRRRPSSLAGKTLSASTYLAALGASSDGVLMLDRAGVIVYANPAAEAFFADDGLAGKHFARLATLDRRVLTGIWRALRRSRRWTGRLCLRRSCPDLDVTVQRVGAEPGVDENFCVLLHGAARVGRGQPEAPNRLQRVASEIAHDFNNQIAVILNYTFVLLRHMPDGSPLKAHVAEMQAAAWRASQVAQAIHRAIVTPQQPALSSGK
ncbi:MAG TPA: PAS domain-containing protein [Polyangiales bacterium]|nr:PAS domain-containing protein [Polyangiales bacterium]